MSDQRCRQTVNLSWKEREEERRKTRLQFKCAAGIVSPREADRETPFDAPPRRFLSSGPHFRVRMGEKLDP
ncbi:MAG: hypothetical protein ACJAVZ_000433 [Afipia broomeae]|jgi:hypothetical protein